MLLGDLATIVQYHLPIKLIVFNNRSLGMVKLEMEVAGLPDWQTTMLNPDFARVALSMGMAGYNVINPDDVVDQIGADAFRMYEMFMGAFDQAIPWSTQSAKGCRRFLDRVWRLQENVTPDEGYSEKLNALMHETIKKVSLDYEAMKYNTAIAQMMTLVNEMVSAGSVTRGELKTLLLLLNPVAPHITEEMWENQGFGGTMTYQKWPTWDEDALVKSEIEIAVQVCGKVRGRVMIPADMTKERAETELQQLPEIQKILAGKIVTKVIFVPGRLVNFIAK